jgi:hypothetical protein
LGNKLNSVNGQAVASLPTFSIIKSSGFKLRLPPFDEDEMRGKMNRTEYIYVGIDIHKETHTAVLVNYLEEPLGEISVDNNVSGFRKRFAYVEKVKGNLALIYGLEDVTHYGWSLAIYLLDKKQTVKEVNSALSFMERMSYASTKKNDAWDAKCIAAVLMRRYEDLLDANPQDYYWTMHHLVN